MSILGVDIGNSGAKAAAFSADGTVIVTAYQEYAHIMEHPGWLEIDPEAVWAAVQYSVRTCNAACIHDPVTAMAVSAMGDGFTPIARDGSVLNYTILTADNRAQEEADMISTAMGGTAKIKAETGAVCHSKYPASKMLWFYRNHPEIHEKTWKYLGWIEMVAYRCGLTPTVDDSNAGKSMLYSLDRHGWHPGMERFIHVEGKLPEIKRSGTVLGIISKEAAQSLGFTEPVTMVLGGFDQACVAMGAGVVQPGSASLGLGTVASLTMVFDEKEGRRFNENNNIYAIMPHTYAGRVVSCATTLTGGQLLKWFRDQFSRWERETAVTTGEDPYELILEDLPEEPTDILVLPHFAGAGTPWGDPYAKGSVFGLTVRHTRKDFVKALLESIAYELYSNLTVVSELGVPVNAIRVSGGGARSAAWLHIIADVTGLPIVPIRAEQVGCCGAAIIAGVGTGVFTSYEEGIERLVKTGQPILPDPRRHELYEERFQIYQGLYERSKQISHALTRLAIDQK